MRGILEYLDFNVGNEMRADFDVVIGIVGISRHHTHEIQPPRTAEIEKDDETLTTTKTFTNGASGRRGYDKPFTDDELTLALTRNSPKPAMTERA